MIDFKKLLSFIFPNKCQYCKEIVPFGTLICNKCLNDTKPQKIITNIEMENGQEVVVVSPFFYENKIKKAICDFKFNSKIMFSEHLGKCLAEAIKENYNIEHIDFITSVPLSKKSKKIRGYNQAEILARYVAKGLNLPYYETLIKIKENKTQHSLGQKERKENVKGVYDVIDSQRILGKQIILCDDIVTTGSTLNECSKMLFLAGAKKVCGITVAKTNYIQK